MTGLKKFLQKNYSKKLSNDFNFRPWTSFSSARPKVSSFEKCVESTYVLKKSGSLGFNGALGVRFLRVYKDFSVFWDS